MSVRLFDEADGDRLEPLSQCENARGERASVEIFESHIKTSFERRSAASNEFSDGGTEKS